jgi:hypothetical protein
MNNNNNHNNNNDTPTLFKVFSQNQISLLSDIHKSIKIDAYGEFKHFKMFRINFEQVSNFLDNLDNNKIYTVIPIISINNNIDEPFITLSRQILVTKHSNPVTVTEFLMEKFSKAELLFDMGDSLQYY